MNSSSSPWAPSLSKSEIWLEEALLDSMGVESIAFGAHMTLFFICVNVLWSSRKRQWKQSLVLLAYISTVFILSGIGIGTALHFTEMAFIDDRNYPGGPGAFHFQQMSLPFNVAGTALYVITKWLQDGFLLYRFITIWNATWHVAVIPALTLLLSIVMSCLYLAQFANPNQAPWKSLRLNVPLAHWTTSFATTVLLSVLILSRLAFLRRRFLKAMGSTYESPYFSLGTVLIESAALYTAFAVAFLITYTRGSTAVNQIFLHPMQQVQSIAPLLIVLRMAQGRAWTRAIVREASSVTGEQFKALQELPIPASNEAIALENRLQSRSSITLNHGTHGRQMPDSNLDTN